MLSRCARLTLLLAWVLVVLYPDPGVLTRSVMHVTAVRVDAAAAASLAATLPDEPVAIERAVLRAVPYESDWRRRGVPWEFPSAAEALVAGRGDCESRALVLASVLAAKGIPYRLRMSLDHIWVDYPGKQANAIENDDLVLAERRDGRLVWRWPRRLDLREELGDQLDIYWTPMPWPRRALLFVGAALLLSWNGIVWRREPRPRLLGGDVVGRSGAGV